MPRYDMSTEIAGQRLKSPIIIASGVLCFADVLEKYLDYIGAATTKSTGPVERAGNQTPTNGTNLNAMGLPNPGCKAFVEELAEAYPRFQKAGVKLYVSVFGDSPEEIAYVTKCVAPVCDGVEDNISCPNIREGEKTGMTVGKDPDLAYQSVSAVSSVIEDYPEKIVIAKQTPAAHIFDRKLGIDVAQACLDAGADVISGINTVPNATDADIYAEASALSTVYGGLSGEPVLPIGLAFIRSMYDGLGPDVPLIGIGGAKTGEHVVKYVMEGAHAVAIGTGFENERTPIIREHIQRIEQEITDIIDKKNKIYEQQGIPPIASLMELRGRIPERERHE